MKNDMRNTSEIPFSSICSFHLYTVLVFSLKNNPPRHPNHTTSEQPFYKRQFKPNNFIINTKFSTPIVLLFSLTSVSAGIRGQAAETKHVRRRIGEKSGSGMGMGGGKTSGGEKGGSGGGMGMGGGGGGKRS